MSITRFFLICQLICSSLSGTAYEKNLVEANKSYQQAEDAVSYGEQQTAFNQALRNYLEVVSQIDYPSGQIYQAIANSYFQLNELAWAILYYEKALKLEPRSLAIQNHLVLARRSLELESQIAAPSLKQKFLLNPFFTLRERFLLLVGIFLIAIGLISILIWISNKLISVLVGLLASLFFVLLCNILLVLSFNPIEGILIESVGYYRQPDFLQTQLMMHPKAAGTKISIIATTLQGDWLKTVDSEGVIGYIPTSSIRII